MHHARRPLPFGNDEFDRGTLNREKRHGSRLNRKIDFDFAGRKVVESEGAGGEYDPAMDDVVKKIMEESGNAVGLAAGAVKRMTMVSDGGGIVNPNLGVPRPTLVS